MAERNQWPASRRRVLGGAASGAAAVLTAGCSFSSSGSENRFSTEQTFDFEAEQGENIRVRIRGTDSAGDDDGGVSGGTETAEADLFGPDGQVVVSLSFRGDGASDQQTISAPASGTYEFTVRPSPDTVRAYIDVGGESVLG